MCLCVSVCVCVLQGLRSPCTDAYETIGSKKKAIVWSTERRREDDAEQTNVYCIFSYSDLRPACALSFLIYIYIYVLSFYFINKNISHLSVIRPWNAKTIKTNVDVVSERFHCVLRPVFKLSYWENRSLSFVSVRLSLFFIFSSDYFENGEMS